MAQLIANGIVMASGTFLILLGLACLRLPASAANFLRGFAATARLHYTELLMRMIVGTAFLVHGPSTSLPTAFDSVAWVLLVTTTIMFVIPWRQHRRFANHAVPIAISFIRPIGAISIAMGAAILLAA